MDSHTPEAHTQAATNAYTTILARYLEHTADLVPTLESLLAPIDQKVTTSNTLEAENLLYALWTAIFQFVSRVPSSSTDGPLSDVNFSALRSLVILLKAIRNVSDKVPSIRNKQFFASLPGFSVQARKRWNDSPATSSSSNSMPMESQAKVWTNLNAFIALLWSSYPDRSVGTTPAEFDFALYSIWTLRQTLETQQTPEMMNATICGAAIWVTLVESATKIYGNNQMWPPSGEQGKLSAAPAKPGLLFQKAGYERIDGFNQERWEFWKKRFGDTANDQAVTEATRNVAREAASKMGEVENANISNH